MNESLAKLVGVVAVAALVVVGIVATSGSDNDVDFTRNAAFLKMPKAQQARFSNSFVQQAAPKPDIWSIGSTLNYVPDGRNDGKVTITSGKTGIEAQKEAGLRGKASVKEGKGVDGKGGTSSIRLGGTVKGKRDQGLNIWTTGGTTRLVPKRIAGFRSGTGMDGVADRIQKWNDCSAPDNLTVDSLKNVLVNSYTAGGEAPSSGAEFGAQRNREKKDSQYRDGVTGIGGSIGSLKDFDDLCDAIDDDKPTSGHLSRLKNREAELLAECMESKVGDVFLKSHVQSSAAACIATVLPAISPDRAKQLGTYWLANVDLQN